MTEQSYKTFSFAPKGQSGKIPRIGLGTATLNGDRCISAVKDAIACGYRHIDTALLYGNQTEVGQAIRASGVAREEVWVTSKVAFFPPNSEDVWQPNGVSMHNQNNVKGCEAESIALCLEQLGLDYVDLLLVHNPCSSPLEYNAACLPHFFELFNMYGSEDAVRPERLADGSNLRELIMNAKKQEALAAVDPAASKAVRRQTWAALEKAQQEGKCRYIGVANYPVELLLEMEEYAVIMPAVNQLELHPIFASPNLRREAERLGIVLTGYGTGSFAQLCEKLPDNSVARRVLADIAARLGVDAQTLTLRWTIQSGVVVIPRSGSAAHIAENFRIVEQHERLSDEDMAALDALNKDYPYYWDPMATTMLLNAAELCTAKRRRAGSPKRLLA